MRRVFTKIVSLILLLAFFADTCCYGLATLPASQNPLVKREISAYLARTNVRIAEDEGQDSIGLLKANNSSGVLLCSGDLLVSRDVRDNDIKLLQVARREEIKALMQILSIEDAPRYRAIKELILRNFPPDKEDLARYYPQAPQDGMSADLYVANITAKAFQWLTLFKDGMILRSEVPADDRGLIDKIEPVLEEHKDTLFAGEFWDSNKRLARIRGAINGGMRFYQTAGLTTSNRAGADIVDRKARFDSLFMRNGKPTGYLRNLIRHFDIIEALVEGRPVDPVSIEIQPSGTCNMNCRYCGFREKRREHKDLYIPEIEMQKLIEDIDEHNKTAPYRLTEIKFNGIFSEPLSGQAKRSTILGIRLAVEKNYWTGLFTNGLELDEDAAKAIVQDDGRSAAFVNISIDAGTWETYHKLKRAGASREEAKQEYIRIMNNISALVERRNRYGAGLSISVSCVLQKETSTPEEVAALIHMAKELGVDNIRFRYPYKVSAGAPMESEIREAYDTIARLIEFYKDDKSFSITQIYGEGEVQEQMQKLFGGAGQETRAYAKCRVPYLRLTVSSDSNFYPCDHRGYKGGGSLGSIADGYGKVIASEERTKKIDAIRPQEDQRCEICAMYNQYLNELLALLEEEHKRDPGLFAWLKKTYRLEGPRKSEGEIRTVTEDRIASGIEAYIKSLPADLRGLYDLSQRIDMHHEGPTLKHHLQAMLELLQASGEDPKVPEPIGKILSDPSNKEFFIQFVLFHDIGKSTSSLGKDHALASYEIAGSQPLGGLEGKKRDMLLKAVRFHMLDRYTGVDPQRFSDLLKKAGFDGDEEFAGLLAAAVYLDGRSTWSDEFGNYNLPDVDNFVASYLEYLEASRIRKAEMEVLKKEAQTNPSMQPLLDYLVGLPPELPRYTAGKRPLSIPEYRDILAREMSGDGVKVPAGRSYKGFASGGEYDPSACIVSIFGDTEFLENLDLLVTDNTGLKRVKFGEQLHLKKFIHEYLSQSLKEYLQILPGDDRLARTVDYYTEEMVRLLGIVTETAYPYYSNEAKDCVLRHFGPFVEALIGEAFSGGAAAIRPESRKKIFTDTLIACLHHQVDSMQEYNDFLPRQLFLTLQIYYERLQRYVKRIGFPEDFTPVFLLSDAEPLSYPFFGLFGPVRTAKSEFVYFNRLSTMTLSERQAYYAHGLDKVSDYTRSLYAADTKIYTFLNGKNGAGEDSAMSRSLREAQSRSREAMYRRLKDKGYSGTDGKAGDAIFEDAYLRYSDDLERYLIVSLAQKVFDLMRSDGEARAALKEIYSFLVPESLKGGENKDRKAVIIDTGIKGSLSLLLSALVLINDIDIKDEEAKRRYLASLTEDMSKLRSSSIRARAFIYGTTSDYRSTVPNAGFERFGFGGVNTFIEQLPKFARFGFLNGRGMPEAAITGDINLKRAHALVKGLKAYAERKDEIKKVSGREELESLVAEMSAKSEDPIYLFIDLDNVMIQPLGYMNSEAWYQTEADSIRYRDTAKRQRLFDYYKRYERHLTDEDGYEALLDIAGLRRGLEQRFDKREVRIVCFSARNETQRETTEKVLKDLGIDSSIDELSLTPRPGMSKKQRMLEYLASRGIDGAERKAQVFVIDDAMHHLAPMLSIRAPAVTPVLFADARENYREKSGLYFFVMGARAFDKGEMGKAKEYYINALKNRYIPLSADDIGFFGETAGGRSLAISAYLRAIEMSYEWLSEEDAARIGRIIVELSGEGLDRDALSRLYAAVSKINKLTGYLKDALKSVYQRVNGEPPDEDSIILWDRLEKAARDYDEDAGSLRQQGISREEAVESALIDQAFGYGNLVGPAQYAARFIRTLSPYFSKKEIIDLFPEGAVFKEELYWIENPSADDYEFYFGGSFFVYHYDARQGRSFLLEAKTYQELRVKLINRLFSGTDAYEPNAIKSVTIFPTLYCNVGCPVCLYASPSEPDANRKDPAMYLSPSSIGEAARLINSYRSVDTLVIGGGGEPFLEMESIEELISSARVKSIKIYTSGDWGSDMGKVNRNFLAIYRALAGRATPVNVEINISADEFHSVNIEGRGNVGYLSNILSAFVKAKERGRFPRVSLHLRGLSDDGNVPEKPDTVSLLLDEIRNRGPRFAWNAVDRRRDGYKVRFENGADIDISYNKIMFRNRVVAKRLAAGMREREDGYSLDRIFINSDGSVSLGGYYKAVPLGDLKEMPPAVLSDLSHTNIVSAMIKERGFGYLLRLAGEYDPNLARSPPPSATEVDLAANMMKDPKARLYIYYRMISDLLGAGRISEEFASALSITKGLGIETMRKMASVEGEELLRNSIARKLNWGFRVGERPSQIGPFSNIWWDTADDAGKETMIRRVKGIGRTGRIRGLITDMLRKKYGIENPDIRSISVVGGYLYNPSIDRPDIDSLINDIRSLDPSESARKWKELFPIRIAWADGIEDQRDIENVMKITGVLIDRPTVEAAQMMKDLGINDVEYLKRLFSVIRRSDILQDVLARGNRFHERVSLIRQVGSYAERLERLFANLEKEVVPSSDTTIPQYLDLYLSDTCFSKCVHCHATEITSDGEVKVKPSHSQLKETVDEKSLMAFLEDALAEGVGREPVRVISMAGVREPLADKRGLTLRAISKARELSKSVVIRLYTDGIGLRKAGVKEVMAACVNQLRISLDAATPGTWQRIHNTSEGSFDEVLADIRKLVMLRKETGSSMQIGLSFLLQRYNYKELPEFLDMASRLGVDYVKVMTVKEVRDKASFLAPDDQAELKRILAAARERHLKLMYGKMDLFIEEDLKEGQDGDRYEGIRDWEKAPEYHYMSWLASAMAPDGTMVASSGHITPEKRDKACDYGVIPEGGFTAFWNSKEGQRRLIKPAEHCSAKQILFNSIIEKMRSDWRIGIAPGSQPFRPDDPYAPVRAVVEYGHDAKVARSGGAESPRIPVKDLDLVVVLGGKGIRDFIPESLHDFGDTFSREVQSIPGSICAWMLSEERLSPASDNIIDIDLALTLLSGVPIEGDVSQAAPAPVIERVKQACLFLNLLLKMDSDMNVIKLYKRRIEIGAIIEQLRMIAGTPREVLLASPNISAIDKKSIGAVTDVLKSYFVDRPVFNRSLAWRELERLYRLTEEKADLNGRSISEGELGIMLSVKRREMVMLAQKERAELLSLIGRLYRIQEADLVSLPKQKSRRWLVEIFKANTPSRSLGEHLGIASDPGIDYSTAASLAISSPYPTAIETLYNTVTSDRCALGSDEKGRVLSLISGNTCLPPSLQKKLNGQPTSGLPARAAEEILVSNLHDIPPSYRGQFLDFMIESRFARPGPAHRSEEALGKKHLIVRETVNAIIGDDRARAEASRTRLRPMLGIGVTGPGSANEDIVQAVVLLVDRILYSPVTGGRQLFTTLKSEECQALIRDLSERLLSDDGGAGIFRESYGAIREISSWQMKPRDPSDKLRIGVVTFQDKEGPSVSNRVNISTMEAALRENGFAYAEYEVIDLQFMKAEELAGRHYDILVLDVRQENFENFCKAVDGMAFDKLADHILIQGSYLSIPGALELVRARIGDKLKDALIVVGEPEPAILGLAERVRDRQRPLVLVPNVSIRTSAGEFRTPARRMDVSNLNPSPYPYIDQMKESGWYNYNVEASRGCAHGLCTFCTDRMLYGPGWRPYSVESVIRTFEELNRRGINTVFMYDKDFWGGDYERAEKIARRLIAIGNKVRYTVALRPDEIIEGEHLLDLFKESGMSLVFIGPESYERNTLKRFNKGVDEQINLEAIKILREHGIDHGLGFIIDPLADIEEVGESLRVIKANGLWQNTASLFNILRVKKGTGYEIMMRNEGLLGELTGDGLTYKSGYKDARVSALVQAIYECLEEVPPLNFIFIISKRRMPLKTEADRAEWDKYNRHFGMLQKLNLDFLIDLTDALGSGHEERVGGIKERYISKYREAVDKIKAELDPNNPISKNILEYIAVNMKAKASRMRPLPFQKRVEKAYVEEREDIEGMLERGVMPKPYQPGKTFSLRVVSRVVGDALDEGDFTAAFSDRLDEVSREFEEFLGDSIITMPKERRCLNLFSVYLNEPYSRYAEIAANPKALQNLQDGVRKTMGLFPIKVHFKGLMLSQSGAVALKGYVDDDTHERLRKILHNQFPNSRRSIHLDRPFVCMTIGRIAKDISPKLFKELIAKVDEHADDDFGFVSVRHPTLDASADFTGFTPHEEAQKVFKPVNDAIRNTGPRLLLASLYDPPSLFGVANISQHRFPLALNTLKGYVKKEYGDSVDVVIMDNQKEEDIGNIVELINKGKFDLVGFSVTIGQKEKISAMLDAIRDKVDSSRRPLVVLGNNFFDDSSREFLKGYPWVIICRHDGEYALGGLIEHLRKKKPLKEIPNILYVENGNIIENPILPVAPEDVAMPTFDALDKVVESGGFLLQWEASRGCPWGACTFCTRPRVCKGWRGFPVEKVLDGLEALQQRGLKEVYFADEDFIGLDLDRSMRIAQGIIDRGIKMDFSCSTSVRDVFVQGESPEEARKRYECFSLLRKAGFVRIMLGTESGSDEQLKRYAKGVTAFENRQAIKILRDEMGYGLIFGFIMFDPFMSTDDIVTNLSFISDMAIEDNLYALGKVRVGELNTYFLNRLKRDGLLDGRKSDANDYRYRFKDAAVAEIVAVADTWKSLRSIYNDGLNKDLGWLNEHHDYLGALFRDLQLAIRRFDVAFLKVVSLCYTKHEDLAGQLSYLKKVGYDDAEIDKVISMIENARTVTDLGSKRAEIGRVVKVLIKKRSDYAKDSLKTADTRLAHAADNYTRAIAREKIYGMIDSEARSMLSSFMTKGYIAKRTSVKLVGITNQLHHLRRNDLTIETLAGDLRGRLGKSVDVAVGRVRDEQELRKLIGEMGSGEMPDVLGISVHMGSLQFVEALMKALRTMESYKKKRPVIVFGNMIPTYFPEEMLKNYPEAIMVRGEGEEALAGLVGYAEGLCGLEDVPNLVYIDPRSSKPVYTRFETPDFERLIYQPSFETVDQIISEGGNIMVQTSRGCSWGRCAFCSKASFKLGGIPAKGSEFDCWDAFPIQRVLDSFETLYSKGIKYMEIMDEDQFVVDRKAEHLDRLETIVEGLRNLSEKYGRKMEFIIFVRPETLYRQNDPAGNERIKLLLGKLMDVGLIRVFVSADSGSQAQLKRYMKGVNTQQVRESVKMLKALGLDARVGFIMFDPELTLEEMLENIKFFREYDLVKHNQQPHRAIEVFVGTPIAERLRQKGLLGELDMSFLRYKYSFEHPEVERIYRLVQNVSAEATPLYATCKEANKYFTANRMDREMAITQSFMERFGNIYLDLMEELALKIKGADDDTVARIVEVARGRVRASGEELSMAVDISRFRTEKVKDLSRGLVNEEEETHPALDSAANDGRIFALTAGQVEMLRSAGDEALADMLMSNLLRLRSPPLTRRKILERLADRSIREILLKGFSLMRDSIRGRPLPEDKPVRLCIVMEAEDLPAIVFKDPYNNLIAHAGRGRKTGTPFTSIYTGYGLLKRAVENHQEGAFKEIVAHEAGDILRGYHVDEEADIAPASKLYDDTLDLYDAGELKVLWLDVLDKPFQEGSVYKVKYDESRLSSAQIYIIKEYVRLLNMKTRSRFDSVAFSSLNGSKDALITVYRQDKGGNTMGTGSVDINIPEEESAGQYALRITGMLNIAVAASNIEGRPSDETEASIAGFIRRQCRLIIGRGVPIPENITDLIKFIRNLPLPKTSRLPTEKIEEYNALAKEALIAA